MSEANLLTRTLELGCRGKDVEGCSRALLRYLGDDAGWRAHTTALPGVRQYFGTGKRVLTKRAQAKAGVPQSGLFGTTTEAKLRQAKAFDNFADGLLDEYAVSIRPKPPPFVEPRQGFESLHRSLWEAYSIGRRAGLSDLGTFNPDSRLPSGRPSDHAVYPAFAFDLGFDPDTGWANEQARRVALALGGRPEIEYVILGNRIHIDGGWRSYSSGGHFNHLHASGRR